MNDDYRDLLTLAARIPPGSEGGMAHDYLNEAGEYYVGELLDTGRDPYEIRASLEADLKALEADPGANPRALALVRQSLMAHFDALPPPPAPPKPRSNLALILLVILGVAIGGVIAFKYASVIAINDSLDTHKGAVERARAVQKVLAADRNGGDLVASLLGWPTAPVASEHAAASELTDKLLSISQTLARDGCGAVPGEASPADLRKFLDGITRNLIAKDGHWETKPAITLREAVSDYQCPNHEARPQSGLMS